MRLLYLDNNATTRPAPEVVAAMAEAVESLWGNPSSVHRFGQAARQRVELARATVAALLGCRDRELIFTSGGTESNNLALRGVLDAAAPVAGAGEPPPRVLITTKVEHSAIRAPSEALAASGVRLVHLPVDRDGLVTTGDLTAALSEHARNVALVLVSIQWANNETGVIQPVAELAKVVQEARTAATTGSARGAKILFHLDATQAVGKVPVNVRDVPADLLTLAAHKFHGPKGVGALYVRTGVRLRPQALGGPQERDRRGGTENTTGVIGMGVAAELAAAFVADADEIERLRSLRDRFERGVVEALPDTVVNSARAPRLWNTTSLGFPRLEAEAILLALSERGLCASAGAACSSGSLEPSPVLLAMGIPEEVAHGSVRFSLSRYTTAEEIDEALRVVPEVVRKLARTLPAGV